MTVRERPIFRDGSFHDDRWTIVENGSSLPSSGDVALGKTHFLAEIQALRARNGGIGVVLNPGEDLDGIIGHLDRITLVVLRLTKYSDGRPYSLARLLRDRHGYQGELRAAGDVLRDQVTFLMRAGFDSLDVSHPATREALRAGSIVAVRYHYQPASAERSETAGPVSPWRRRSL
jgi:phosphoadenosine phosphosulfate reductase